MKDFIYLDTNIVESYLAQDGQGLIKALTNSHTNEENNITSKTFGGDQEQLESALNILKAFHLGGKYTFNNDLYRDEIGASESATTLINKIMHDNIFDIFLDKYKEKLHYINDKFYIFDIEFLTNLFLKEYLPYKELAYQKELDDFREEAKKNNPQMRDGGLKKIEQSFKKDFAEENKNIKYVIGLFSLISKLFPCDKFIVHNNIFIPIESKYLRYDAKKINYYFSGNTKIYYKKLGTFKNYFSSDTIGDLSDVLDSMNEVVKVGLEFFNLDENSEIILPIAWYKENF